MLPENGLLTALAPRGVKIDERMPEVEGDTDIFFTPGISLETF